MSENQKTPKPKPGDRFSYVRYDEISMAMQEDFKAKFIELEEMVLDRVMPGRAQSLVFTKLEEAYMWVGKAIRDDQNQLRGQAQEQPERKDG